MKIKVVSLDGARPRFGQYLLRWLFRIVDFTISFQAAGLICAAVTLKQQRIGDIVAGTAVIKTKPRTQSKNIVFRPVENDYTPVFGDVSALTSRDITLITEVIHTFRQTANQQVLASAASRLRELLSVSNPEGMNDLKFLQTIIRDYTHYSVQADE